MDDGAAMRQRTNVPVLATVRQAYALLWEHRAMHAKAIWPPVVFLVTAEFLYHRIVGNAEGLMGRLHAVLAAPWWMPLVAVVAWLAGLKFLLSFSISWRRHLLLEERFDPFFFKAPFWRYLGFLLLTYAWIVPLVLVSFLPAVVVGAATHSRLWATAAAVVFGVSAFVLAVFGVVRQVPFFTMLTLDPPHPGWRESVSASRGLVTRYVATFVLTMLPLFLLNLLLDLGLKFAGADRHAVHVALGEAAFRQAMLFLHFSLGASIGAVVTMIVLPEARERLPGAPAVLSHLRR